MQPNYFSIPKPCSENWNEMTPTEQGAFCSKCTKEVLDLTATKSSKIRAKIAANANPCIRISNRQMDEINWWEWFNSLTLKKQLNHVFLIAFLFAFKFNGSSQQPDTLAAQQNNVMIDSLAPVVLSDTILPVYRTIDSISCPEIFSTNVLWKEEYDIMGIPPAEPMVTSADFNGLTHDLNLTDYFILGDTIAPISTIQLSNNWYTFDVFEDELILTIDAHQTETVEFRIYSENNRLVYADRLRIELGFIEIPVSLINYNEGTYTAKLKGDFESQQLQFIYP